MDSQFMDAGTYAWVVIIIFFLIFFALQIRNCIRNVRGSNNNFADMYPNEAGTSCGANQSSVYTIDVHRSTPTSNFTNPGYVSTEGAVKGQTNDGLPTYEEAISGVKTPIAPAAPVVVPTVDVVNEESENASSSRGRRNRHRHHRRHHHHNSEQQNENDQPDAPEESRRHRHRRGFRLKRHLAKINRRNNPETE